MNLADIYSYLESLRRGTKGLLANPAETLNQWGSQIKEDLGKYDQGNQRAMGLLGAGDYSGAGKAAVQNNMGLGSGLLGALHIAYHGTPHTVDKFDMSKVGTGEGAQAYGHGLYFADNPQTAKAYQSALGGLEINTPSGGVVKTHGDGPMGKTGEQRAAGWVSYAQASDRNNPVTYAYQLATKTGESPDVMNILKNWSEGGATARPGGNLYKVDINADPAHYLDWDKPLNEQTPAATKVLKDFHTMNGGQGYEHPQGYAALGLGSTDAMTGKDLYQWLIRNSGGPQDASALMKSYGIPGIKYKDAGSRAADGGTHNYVVFDDSLINNLGPQP